MAPLVLVVDDEIQIREALKSLLEDAGYTVVAAENGRVALKTIRTKAVDLMIIDLIMPEKEGIETIIQIKKEHPEIKIVAISGGGRRAAPDNALEMAGFLGADAVFAKPVDNGKLLGAVGKLLHREDLKRGPGREIASKDD